MQKNKANFLQGINCIIQGKVLSNMPVLDEKIENIQMNRTPLTLIHTPIHTSAVPDLRDKRTLYSIYIQYDSILFTVYWLVKIPCNSLMHLRSVFDLGPPGLSLSFSLYIYMYIHIYIHPASIKNLTGKKTMSTSPFYIYIIYIYWHVISLGPENPVKKKQVSNSIPPFFTLDYATWASRTEFAGATLDTSRGLPKKRTWNTSVITAGGPLF